MYLAEFFFSHRKAPRWKNYGLVLQLRRNHAYLRPDHLLGKKKWNPSLNK